LGELENCNAIFVGRLFGLTHLPAISVVPSFPQFDLRAAKRLAFQRVAEINQRLFSGGLEQERCIRDKHEIARTFSATIGFEQVSPGFQPPVEM